MSVTAAAPDDGVPSSRHRPRRTFELTSSPPSPSAITPPFESRPSFGSLDGTDTPSRTRSILNLTSSPLYGIYQATGYAPDREEPYTPWGNGAVTPIGESPKGSLDLSKAGIPDTVLLNGPNGKVRRRRSTAQPAVRRPRHGFQGHVIPRLTRLIVLGGAGVLYGALVTHLHDHRELAPVKVEGIHRNSWTYLVLWGLAGVLLGEALPLLDELWGADSEEEAVDDSDDERTRQSRGISGWNDILRSVGAFVGVAFAIRKLPWQSTLQLSLTLALANPAVWYVIDRSTPGFLLSAIVSVSGTALLLSTNPQLVPTPASSSTRLPPHRGGINSTAPYSGKDAYVLGMFSQESVGVATWIASVLFFSAVCFGNIGRRLARE